MKRTTAFAFCILGGAGLAHELPRFDVASIKPAATGDPQQQQMMDTFRSKISRALQLQISGKRVEAINYTLAQLIAAAFGVSQRQLVGPDWLADQRFNVEAVIPSDAPNDGVNEMMQALLQERFGLVAHRETRNQPGYILTVTKGGPNLKASKPATSASTDALSPDSRAQLLRRQGTPGRSHYESRDCTLEDLTQVLSDMLQLTVENQTGLKGKYDVVLDVPPARDPKDNDPQLRILDAVRKLGLSVKSGKVPTPMIVIDSIQKTPTAN